ncbi:MAG: transposase [Bacteroidota bacterium]
MKFNNKSIRWQNWDYSSTGAYFITICTKFKERYFGESIKPPIYPEEDNLKSYLIPSPVAEIAYKYWKEIPEHYDFVVPDLILIMPDHVHGILFFEKEIKQTWERTKFGPQKNNLPDVIRAYKGAVTKWANANNCPFRWQSRYYDRVIRNEEEFRRIKAYIMKNPIRWDAS